MFVRFREKYPSELRAALSLAKLYQSTGRAPTPTPCSRPRSKAFRRPGNSLRSKKRKMMLTEQE
jgi:hypothetical protein